MGKLNCIHCFSVHSAIWTTPCIMSFLLGNNARSATLSVSYTYLVVALCFCQLCQAVADLGFSRGGGANSQNCYYFSHFCRKLHENERIWTPRGGRASLAPPLGSANVWYSCIFTYSLIVSCLWISDQLSISRTSQTSCNIMLIPTANSDVIWLNSFLLHSFFWSLWMGNRFSKSRGAYNHSVNAHEYKVCFLSCTQFFQQFWLIK